MKKILLIAMLALAAPVAGRADGTTDILINPATGYAISVSGSYRLVADVTLTANVTGIQIGVGLNNVTIDLNGHTITAAAGNVNSGIDGTFSDNVTISNGSIVGFGFFGIVLGEFASVRDCKVFGNNTGGAGGGILGTNNSAIEHCIVSRNTAANGTTVGIQVASNSRVCDNIVDNNDSQNSIVTGILAGSDATILNNIVRENTANGGAAALAGIAAGPRCTIRGNVVTDNDHLGTGDAVGITAGTGCVIDGNNCSGQTTGTTGAASATGITSSQSTITNNDCLSNVAGPESNGNGRGINGGTGSLVRGNRCEGNNGSGNGNGAGILATNGCRIEDNHCRSNSGSFGALGWGIRVTSTTNLVVGNSTQGNGTAGMVFTIAGSNRVESNRMREGIGIDLSNGFTPTSVGTGDLANVVY